MSELCILVNIKSVGKRKAALTAMPYVLADSPDTLRDLIMAIAENEVGLYNAKETDTMLLPFLTQEQIEDQSSVGKIGFGRIYSDKKEDPKKAIETALQAFEDGLFRVAINEAEVQGLDTPINIKDGDTLTFIRLTFLAGRLW